MNHFRLDIQLLTPTAKAPTRGSAGAAGYDLYADFLDDYYRLAAGQYATIPTGIAIGLPAGFEGQIRPRSGLAAKHGITVLNAPGTIDSDYTGELKVILINHSSQYFKIQRHDRIAQLVIARHEVAMSINIMSALPTTARGEGGFGSTGIGVQRLGDPQTTDYCVKCGESPESGTHCMPGHGHKYVDPRIAKP